MKHVGYPDWMNTAYIPPRTIERLLGSPLCPYVKRYVTLRQEEGYTRDYTRDHVVLFSHLNAWMRRTRRTLSDLNERTMERFFSRCWRQAPWCGGRPALYCLLAMLREDGAAPLGATKPVTPFEPLLEDFRQHLSRVRGCVPRTGIKYSYYLTLFLVDRFGSGPADLSQLSSAAAIEWVQRMARERSRGHTQKAVTALRSFLRFLLFRGSITSDLAIAVPNVASWRMTALPRPLAANAVKQVLDGCSRLTTNGRRNYAILLLLARLGLRAGEIIAMELEDIDWENARLTVRSRKGQGWQRMPLPADVGRAIAGYLRTRPACACRHVFVRSKAPHRPLRTSSAISFVAAQAIHAAGVVTERTGAHLFRHSLAASMLRGGASLDEIGQVLRHSNRDTTASYAKVDLGALRPLALSWPGGAR